MCGRYTLTTKPGRLVESFGLDEPPADLAPRYNIAPSQEVAVVPNAEPRRLQWFKWGLVPGWAKDPAIGNRMINARAETVADKPSFRAAFRSRRCLVLADGFFEWKRDGRRKTPVYIRLKSRAPFAFAGLWETWKPSAGEPLRSCTVITTAPNELVADIHDRMPVILAPDAYAIWLSAEAPDPDVLATLLVPYPAGEMEAFAVSTLVNAPTHDQPECIEPAQPAT